MFAVSSLLAGLEQEFFASTVKKATTVKILKNAGRGADGKVMWNVLLDSDDRANIKEVVSAIEMGDAVSVKESNGEEAWVESGLAFGIPDCTIEFTHDGKSLLKYWLEASPITITAAGPRANYGPNMMLARPLTTRSKLAIAHLLERLSAVPNQHLSTTDQAKSGDGEAGGQR